MPEFSDPIWEKIFFWITAFAFIFAAIGTFGAFASAIIGYKISDATQQIANTKIHESDQKIQEASKAIAEANAKAAEANQIAEQERLARLKLEAKLAPRSISSEQALAIFSIAKTFPGTTADIFVPGTTTDASTIANFLLNCLRQASWNVESWTWSGVGAIAGVIIFTDDNADSATINAAIALNGVLLKSGITSTIQKWPGSWDQFGGMLNGPPFTADKAKMRIVVGDKPPS